MKGRLKIIILKALAENPNKSGAELSRIINKKIGAEPSPGSLYPLLNNLNEKGLVETEKDGKNKIYCLSKKGRDAIEGFENYRKDIMDKVIRGLKTYEYVFDEGELEEIIDHLKCLKTGPENLPDYVIQLERIRSLLLNREIDEDKALHILKDVEKKLNEVSK